MKTNTIVVCANAKASKKNIATPKPAQTTAQAVSRSLGGPVLRRAARIRRARSPR